MKLSVVMPVYNEARTVRAAVESVLALRAPFEIELIAVDDGSTDGTAGILGDVASNGALRIITRAGNGGKGLSVRDGFKAAAGDAVIIYDADLEYDAADIVPVAMPVLEGRTQACFGSRFLARPPASNLYGLFNMLMRLPSSAAAGQDMTDAETCLKCFSRRLARSMILRSCGFGIEAELLVEASGRGGIIEVPVSYRPRGRSEGKKIRGRDAVLTLWNLAAASARKKSRQPPPG